MPSLDDIPDDLLNPEEPELFLVWLLALPLNLQGKQALANKWTSLTGALISPLFWRAMKMEDRRRNG